MVLYFFFFFFFNDPATTEIYTLSLHDALPISGGAGGDLRGGLRSPAGRQVTVRCAGDGRDRKSTRLNSSHVEISYAVFCLKKKKKKKKKHKTKTVTQDPKTGMTITKPTMNQYA